MGKVLISIIILITIIAGCVAEKKEAVPVITGKTNNEKISNVEANLRKLVSENSNSDSTTDSAIQKGVYVSSSEEIKYYSFEYLIDTKNSELLKKIAENLISEEKNGKVSTFVVLKDGLALNGNELESSSLTDAKKVEATAFINSETTVKDMRLNINKKSGQSSVRCTLFQENGKAGIKISKDEKSPDEIKKLFNTKNRILIQLTNDTESKNMKIEYTVNIDESGNSIISFTEPILNNSSNSKGYTVKLGDVKGFFVFTFMDTNNINNEKIYIEDSKIVLNSSSVNIKVGEIKSIEYNLKNIIGTIQDIRWSSSNAQIAEVRDGVITGKSAGEAEITVSCYNGELMAKAIVTVENKIIKATGLNISGNKSMIEKGEKVILTAIITPLDSTNKVIKWNSSNLNTAIVDENGVVTGVGRGETIITAKLDGIEASYKIKVEEKIAVTGIEISSKEINIKIGESTNLEAVIKPENADNKKVKWSSSSIVSLIETDKSNKIEIVGKEAGSTEVKVISEDGSYTAICKVTVVANKISVTDVKLDKESFTLESGGSVKLNYTLYPENATVKEVKWSSSNPEVATIDSYGIVRGIGAGSTEITITSIDGSHRAVCKITVNKKIVLTNEIILSNNSLKIKKGDTIKLNYDILPANATNNSVIWRSLNTSVVTVDNVGNISGLAIGDVVVSVASVDGGCYTVCYITVVENSIDVSGLKLDWESITIEEKKSRKLNAIISPVDATNKTVIWNSSNTSIATVDSNGNVQGISPGSVLITVTTEDGKYKANCSVTVKAAIIPVSEIKLSRANIRLTEGESENLTAELAPSNATNKEKKWTSSDTNIAIVDNNGKITAKTSGSAVITVISTDGEKKASCNVTVVAAIVPVTGVVMKQSDVTIMEGDSIYLAAVVSPLNATNPLITWSTSDSKIVTVSEIGKMSGIGAGSAIITVKTNDGGFTSICKVTIVSAPVPLTGIKFKQEEITILEGERVELIVEFLPSNATNRIIYWSTSNPNAVTVEMNGSVSGISAGGAIITVKTEDGRYIANCRVTVKAVVINVTGVTVTPSDLTIVEGNTGDLTATVLPINATNKGIGWSSSNTAVAEVDNNGRVTGKTTGSAVITATTSDGNYKSICNVTVSQAVIKVTGVTLSQLDLTIVEGNTGDLTATVLPANATNKGIGWSSSNTAVAEVDNNGRVTGKTAGNVVITATTSDGNYKSICNVTVSQAVIKVTGVTLSQSDLTITEGNTGDLTATVLPSNATNKGIGWSSSDTSVAEVDNNGRVTGRAAGSTVITATTSDGNYKSTCNVTVSQAVIKATGVTVSQSDLTITEGNTGDLIATVLPANATNKVIVWSSSNTAVAEVDDIGRVTGKKAGTAEIIVTTAEGSYTTKCTVTVKAAVVLGAVTGVQLNYSKITIAAGFAETLALTATVLPTDAFNKNVIWSSRDSNIAIVDNNGNVRGTYTTGVTTIVVETVDGKYQAECEVTVKKINLISIWAHPNLITAKIGKTITGITIDYTPVNATDKRVTYTSLNTNIATVDSYGTITTKGLGIVDIIIKAEDGGFETGVNITVTE